MKSKVKKAVTLIELVFVIVLVGILAGIFSVVLVQIIDNYSLVESRQDIMTQMKMATDWIVKDIREIDNDGKDPEVSQACATAITFIKVDSESVAYVLSGNQILRNGNVLCEGVTTLQFNYRDQGNNVLDVSGGCMNSGQRKRIHHMIVELSFSRGDQSSAMSSWVVLRNVIM
ncbi:MAG: type II secretion system protein [Candidatus Omnitrophota bacterium]